MKVRENVTSSVGRGDAHTHIHAPGGDWLGDRRVGTRSSNASKACHTSRRHQVQSRVVKIIWHGRTGTAIV